MGGGYLSIDEFIDQYTPGEADKIERNNPVKRFIDKFAVQQAINTSIRSNDSQSPKRNMNPPSTIKRSNSNTPQRKKDQKPMF